MKKITENFYELVHASFYLHKGVMPVYQVVTNTKKNIYFACSFKNSCIFALEKCTKKLQYIYLIKINKKEVALLKQQKRIWKIKIQKTQ